MRVLDLFSGLGGFSAAFRDRGHTVVTCDIEERFKPTIRADVRTLRGERGIFDAVLASPVCKPFIQLPWYDPPPDDGLWAEAERLIGECDPRYWVIENVRGAQRFHGRAVQHVGSRYLWGDYPIINPEPVYGKERIGPSPDRPALRARIPYPLSLALCLAMEAES